MTILWENLPRVVPSAYGSAQPSLHPVHTRGHSAAGIHCSLRDCGFVVGDYFRGLFALLGPQGGSHGECVYTGRGHLGDPVSIVGQDGRSGRHDSRTQHRSDGGFGRGIAGFRGGGHHAGDPYLGFRFGGQPGAVGGGVGRTSGDFADDPAASPAHRSAAWGTEISGRCGLRGGAQGGSQ